MLNIIRRKKMLLFLSQGYVGIYIRSFKENGIERELMKCYTNKLMRENVLTYNAYRDMLQLSEKCTVTFW